MSVSSMEDGTFVRRLFLFVMSTAQLTAGSFGYCKAYESNNSAQKNGREWERDPGDDKVYTKTK